MPFCLILKIEKWLKYAVQYVRHPTTVGEESMSEKTF